MEESTMLIFDSETKRFRLARKDIIILGKNEHLFEVCSKKSKKNTPNFYITRVGKRDDIFGGRKG